MEQKKITHKVTKHTRAKKNGTIIICPNCHDKHTVYHFSWSALGCRNCSMIEKLDWILSDEVAPVSITIQQAKDRVKCGCPECPPKK